jgi:hypothetical protein
LRRFFFLSLAPAVFAQRAAAGIADENCTAVYIPRERSLAPNDSTLYVGLLKLGSICDPGIAPKVGTSDPRGGQVGLK